MPLHIPKFWASATGSARNPRDEDVALKCFGYSDSGVSEARARAMQILARMYRLLAALHVISASAAGAGAQDQAPRHHGFDGRVGVTAHVGGAPERTLPSLRFFRIDCDRSPVGYVLVGAAGGAITGWIVSNLVLGGVMSGDGRRQQAASRNAMLIGAGVFSGIAAWEYHRHCD